MVVMREEGVGVSRCPVTVSSLSRVLTSEIDGKAVDNLRIPCPGTRGLAVPPARLSTPGRTEGQNRHRGCHERVVLAELPVSQTGFFVGYAIMHKLKQMV